MYNIIFVHIIYYKISTLIVFTNLNTIKLPYLILCIVGLHINMTCSLHVSKSILTSHLISEEETFKLDCFCIKPSKLYYCAFYKLFIAYMQLQSVKWDIGIYCEMQMTGHELNSLLWDSSFSLDLGLLSICGRVHLNLVLNQTFILSCSFLVTAYNVSCVLLRFKSKQFSSHD